MKTQTFQFPRFSKAHLQHAPGLLVDEARNPLDAAPPGQPPDGGLGDALDVVTEHLPVPLGASFPQSLASFAASGHVESVQVKKICKVYM